MKFREIEGVRAWLAWTVFAYHVLQLSGTAWHIGIPYKFLAMIGDGAVQIFIIISGFVITHLLVSKQETYFVYITRRFFRLFPVLLVCCVAGAISLQTAKVPWVDNYPWAQYLAEQRNAMHDYFLAQIVAHVTMLHGAIPNNILPQSQYVFVGPAWSVSLEWQFYLTAPLCVWAITKTKSGGSFVALAVVAGLIIYGKFFSPLYGLPSFLPGSAQFFLIGIASKLFYKPDQFGSPLAVAIAAFGIGFLSDQFSLGVWVAFYAYLGCKRGSIAGWDKAFVDVLDIMFVSRPALGAGNRTYCVYLVHIPVLLFLMTAMTIAGITSMPLAAAILFLAGSLLTVIAAEFLHRLVEKPGIEFGRTLSQRATALA